MIQGDIAQNEFQELYKYRTHIRKEAARKIWLIEKLTATFISFMPPLAFLAIVIALQPINHIYFYVFAIVIAFFLDKYCVYNCNLLKEGMLKRRLQFFYKIEIVDALCFSVVMELRFRPRLVIFIGYFTRSGLRHNDLNSTSTKPSFRATCGPYNSTNSSVGVFMSHLSLGYEFI